MYAFNVKRTLFGIQYIASNISRKQNKKKKTEKPEKNSNRHIVWILYYSCNDHIPIVYTMLSGYDLNE